MFPLHRPSGVVGMPERCSPARIRFAALTRVLACSAPFRQISTCDGRLRREHLSDSRLIGTRPKNLLTAAGLLMEVAVIRAELRRIGKRWATRKERFEVTN